MFRFGSKIGARFASAARWGRNGRNMSTTAAEEKTSKFAKTKDFFYDNRQPLINTIAMAYVVYYAIYNTQVKAAWDARELEVEAIQKELDGYKEVLSDEKWLGELDAKVRNGSSSRAELGKSFHGLFKGDSTKFIAAEEVEAEGKKATSGNGGSTTML